MNGGRGDLEMASMICERRELMGGEMTSIMCG
jgi:hypothetical protein